MHLFKLIQYFKSRIDRFILQIVSFIRFQLSAMDTCTTFANMKNMSYLLSLKDK